MRRLGGVAIMPWRLFGRGEKGAPKEPRPDSVRRERVVRLAGSQIPAVTRGGAILVPVDGSPASLEALSLACNLARRPKGKVYCIHVIEVPRSLPLDADLGPEAARGEEILLQAEEAARSVDYGVEGELLQAREAGQALVDEAVSRGVELIIMGMEYRRPMGDFQMGRLPQYVLRNAPCEVWIIRRAASGVEGLV